MTWSQNYAPLGSVGVSALVAVLPVVTLLGLLGLGRVRAHFAALAGLLVAVLIAIAVYRMPAQLTLAAAIFGAAFGLFPIGWILLNAIFVYDLSVESGQFAVLQNQLSGVSRDRRIQALLIAFCFGAFVEGAAGFGAPVAITGALLIGVGFRPLEAAKLALIGNTAPVAFGSVGIPIVTLNKVTGLDIHLLSAMVGRQLPIFSFIVPFWLIVAQVGWTGMTAVWPACFVTGLCFGATQFLVSNYHGPWLVDMASSVVSMLALMALLKFWKPKDEQPAPRANEIVATETSTAPGSAWKAWLPWVLLSMCVFVWGLPKVKDVLNNFFAPGIQIPVLHRAVLRVPPVVKAPAPEDAIFSFNALSATGTALLCAGILSGACLGLGPKRILQVYIRTISRVRLSLLTIALMLALGYTTRYSGTDSTLGLTLAASGFLFPFFSPLIGWLGVALTGSDTSSNVLFGNLQQVTAQQLALSPILTAASNSSGGVMGKMIDAQSIVVASVATGGRADSPDAGTVLRSVFWHSLALAALMGLLVMLQAYVFPGMIPTR
ncbi:MAG TPA: L-lactate permease [Verrucomicrobiae bacterium]|nr:L-lactate permease [Verrucomicrobiae bacterium]